MIPHRFFLLAAFLGSLSPVLADDSSLSRMKADLFFLAGPECEGRGVQTAGIHKAADYIAAQFKAAGLKPLQADGSYFQPFDIAGAPRLGTPNTLTLTAPNGKRFDLKYGTDFTPTGQTASGSKSAGVVFAGYGITSDNPKYDDYANLEVKGKWVVVLRQAPRADDKAPAFDPHKGSPHPALVSKLANAVKHGAAGVMFVNHKSEAKDDPLMEFGYAVSPDEGVPVLQVKRAFLEQMLAASGKKLSVLEASADENLSPPGCALPGWVAAAEVTVVRPNIPAKNVIGIVEGAGPLADETIVIGAHYDHLGHGDFGSAAGKAAKGQVHYGADDNASGTTGLIELARRFAAMKNRQGRRIVFAAFSGEEIDLLGSKHYCRKPPFPLEKTAFMVNMDMIGRSGLLDAGGLAAVAGLPVATTSPSGWKITQRLVINGVGTAEGLDQIVAKSTHGAGFNVITRNGGTGPSDHDSFYRKRIPVLFLYTGSHRDYHRPSDTPDKIDLDGVLKVVDLVEAITLKLATQEAPPKYLVVRESWEDPTEPAANRPRRAGPKLGIMPGNYDSPDGGVLVDDVSPGGAAEKGGIKAGDIIITIAGQPIKNIGNYMSVMGGQKPGEEINVTVVRKDQKVTVKVKPTQ